MGVAGHRMRSTYRRAVQPKGPGPYCFMPMLNYIAIEQSNAAHSLVGPKDSNRGIKATQCTARQNTTRQKAQSKKHKAQSKVIADVTSKLCNLNAKLHCKACNSDFM